MGNLLMRIAEARCTAHFPQGGWCMKARHDEPIHKAFWRLLRGARNFQIPELLSGTPRRAGQPFPEVGHSRALDRRQVML
jgi:hypothetical protein